MPISWTSAAATALVSRFTRKRWMPRPLPGGRVHLGRRHVAERGAEGPDIGEERVRHLHPVPPGCSRLSRRDAAPGQGDGRLDKGSRDSPDTGHDGGSLFGHCRANHLTGEVRGVVVFRWRNGQGRRERRTDRTAFSPLISRASRGCRQLPAHLAGPATRPAPAPSSCPHAWTPDAGSRWARRTWPPTLSVLAGLSSIAHLYSSSRT